MEISVVTGDILQRPSELAALACLRMLHCHGEVADLLEPGDFRGRSGQTLCFIRAAL